VVVLFAVVVGVWFEDNAFSLGGAKGEDTEVAGVADVVAGDDLGADGVFSDDEGFG